MATPDIIPGSYCIVLAEHPDLYTVAVDAYTVAHQITPIEEVDCDTLDEACRALLRACEQYGRELSDTTYVKNGNDDFELEHIALAMIAEIEKEAAQ